MRSWLFYSAFVVLLFSINIAAAFAVPGDGGDGKRILIINSYGAQTIWSKKLVDSIENRIHNKHPEWLVYSGDLKTETAVYSTAATLTLRSLLWEYAERTHTSIEATSLKVASLFVQDDIPNAIVWIGEEGFLNYLSYAISLGKWREIPMVLCAVEDSVAAGGWYPERGFNFDLKHSIRDYNVLNKKIAVKDFDIKELKDDKNVKIAKKVEDGKPIYDIAFKLNYSGNIAQYPIRQNLELIHRLLPDLKELIWVDDESYRNVEARLEVERLIKEMMPDVKYGKMLHNRINTDSIYP